MKHLLDDKEYVRSHDRGDMLSVLRHFPSSSRKALYLADELDLDFMPKKIISIVVAGMGGSAIGGILLKDWLRDVSKTPIYVSRKYRLPTWVNDSILIYAVSYSGNTEETLSQYRQAVNIGCPLVCFCSGGKLSQNASIRNIPYIKFPEGYQPRAAIAFQFFGLASVTNNLGIISNEIWEEVEEAISVAEGLSKEMDPRTPLDSNPGKDLAEGIMGYTPYVYGSSLHEGVAYRYSTQFNENSKSPAYSSFFPEAFHNSIMAREAPPGLLKNACAVIINDPHEEEALAAKIDKFTKLLEERFGKVVKIEARGEGRLARMISALYIGDFASAYLGILYGKDPSTTESISTLKKI